VSKLYNVSHDFIPIAHHGREWEGRLFMLFPSYARLTGEERERLKTIARYQERVDKEDGITRKRVADLSVRTGQNLVPFLDEAKRHETRVAAASYRSGPVIIPAASTVAKEARRFSRHR
jgi:hypothetical protein